MIAPDNSMKPDLDRLDDLIHLRMPEDQVRQMLLELAPDKVTPEILAQLLDLMSRTVVSLPELEGGLMDCCGTGGSGLAHYNTSTTVAFVLAAGGLKVVKFGNRAASSKSGSFDFLEAIGIPAENNLEKLPEILAQTGLVFLYAPQCYPALAPLAKLRRELGIRTVFNFLGPLLNPVKPAYRLLGVSHPGMQNLMAEYLAGQTETKRAWLVHGLGEQSGLDEVAVHGDTRLLEVAESEVREKTLSHRFDGMLSMDCEYTAADNYRIFRALLDGSDTGSVCYRMVCLNAGSGFYVAGKADSPEAGVKLAEELLAEGKVKETVTLCRKVMAGGAA